MDTMRKFARTRGSKVSSPALTRWGGALACLAGLSYGAWGYLDNPDAPEFITGAVLPVLKLATPALFLGASWASTPGSAEEAAA